MGSESYWNKPQELRISSELGKGSYGVVTEAHDEKGNRIASKRCETGEDGIMNLLEASIMATLHHPFLNTAKYIHPTSGYLYIFQDLAEGGDLAQATRRDRVQAPPPHQVRDWCFALLQAVQYLHSHGIIHGDIKASNVLLYQDGSIKLSDYSLSVKMWGPDHQSFTHTVCTYTHRPLECLLGRAWDTSLDIWSLGCTFGEIAYGDLIFPQQSHLWTGPRGRRSTQTRREYKRCLRERSVNCLIDWATRKEVGGMDSFPIEKYDINYCHYTNFPEFTAPEYTAFNSLLFSMLAIDPSKRPPAERLLLHSYFSEAVPHNPVPALSHNTTALPRKTARTQSSRAPILRNPKFSMKGAETSRVERQLSRHLGNTSSMSFQLAFSLYKKCRDLKEVEDSIKIAACSWIASKLVTQKPPHLDLELHHILSAERLICTHLRFRLHDL